MVEAEAAAASLALRCASTTAATAARQSSPMGKPALKATYMSQSGGGLKSSGKYPACVQTVRDDEDEDEEEDEDEDDANVQLRVSLF